MERQRAAGAALAEPAAARNLSASGRAARAARVASIPRAVRAARASLAACAAPAAHDLLAAPAAPAGPRHLPRHILHVAAVVIRYKINL